MGVVRHFRTRLLRVLASIVVRARRSTSRKPLVHSVGILLGIRRGLCSLRRFRFCRFQASDWSRVSVRLTQIAMRCICLVRIPL